MQTLKVKCDMQRLREDGIAVLELCFSFLCVLPASVKPVSPLSWFGVGGKSFSAEGEFAEIEALDHLK